MNDTQSSCVGSLSGRWGLASHGAMAGQNLLVIVNLLVSKI